MTMYMPLKKDGNWLKRWSLCRTGALQLDLDTTPEGFPVVLRAKCPSWQEVVVVGLT